MKTTPSRLVAGLLLCGSLLAISAVASEPALTTNQQTRQRQLQRQLRATQPTHQLTLRNGQVLLGQIVNETAAAVRLRECSGYSGFIETTYQRATIARLEALPAKTLAITRDDVRLADEFPQYHFVKQAPYTIVTDAPYAQVERTLRTLTGLRAEFVQRFAPLLRSGNAENIQIIFFSREDSFRAYARQAAPGLAGSAGFYSGRERRLVLLDQLGTQNFAAAQSRIDQRWRVLADRDSRLQASARLADVSSGLVSEAKEATERLIRHEGAHQLFAAYRVHSDRRYEPTWLTEGLAQYCETSRIGAAHPQLSDRLRIARRTGALEDFDTLLEHRHADGFLIWGAKRAKVAYAESWALVQFLMQDRYREGFYKYIEHFRKLKSREDEQPVTDFIGISMAAFEAQWADHLSRF